ncbi:MAG: phasin family protein [Kaistia sp. SCN 65-12]|nr:MAG: phasin family protein [Kaistia sp. SCN 65-12]
MSDTTAAPKGAKAGAKAARGFDAPFEAFNINMPNVEVPAAFREIADKAVTNSKDAYAKLKTATEDATEAFEDSYETTRSGLVALTRTSLDNARSHTDAAFAFARDFMGVKSFAEAVELQAAFARKQFETLSEQTRELQTLAQKVSTDATRPVRENFEKVFKGFQPH